MRLLWPNNLIRANRLYRALAVFFLLFTAVDLSFPSLCQAEEPVIAQTEAAESLMALPKQDAPSDQPSEHCDFEEDCFCCCSHIIPSPHVGVAEQMQPPRIPPAMLSSTPAAPSRDMFHPPRLA